MDKELSEETVNKNILTNEEYDSLIKNHIEKMWGGLEMASVQYFIETGKVNGSFRLRLLSLMQFHLWKVQSHQIAKNGDNLSEETVKRIEEESKVFWSNSSRNGYIAGATSEAKRSLIELEEKDKEIERLNKAIDELVMSNMTNEYDRAEAERFRPEYERQLLEPLTTERDAYKEALDKISRYGSNIADEVLQKFKMR